MPLSSSFYAVAVNVSDPNRLTFIPSAPLNTDADLDTFVHNLSFRGKWDIKVYKDKKLSYIIHKGYDGLALSK